MARRDRERARRRRAIERSRQAAQSQDSQVVEPAEPAGRKASRSRPPTRRPSTTQARPRGTRDRSQPVFRKLRVGDVDAKGRVFERSMFLHQRTAMIVYAVIMAVLLASLASRPLRVWSMVLYPVAILVLADSQPTRLRARMFMGLAVLIGALVVYSLIAFLRAGAHAS